MAATIKPTGRPAAKKKKISKEDIRRRAQEIFEERMKKYLPGDAETDWKKAEEELKSH